MFQRLVVKISLMVCILAVCVFTTSAFADDLFAPPWRGAPGTTVQEWDFLTIGTYNTDLASWDYLPDGTEVVPYVNPYGDPIAHAYPGVGQEYWDVWGGRDGVWPLSGVIDVEVPNTQEPNPYKVIWVQLTWAKQTPESKVTPIVTVDPIYTVTGPMVMNDVILGPTGELPPADDMWRHTTWKFIVEPNPDFEVIRISGTVMVDQIVIDTWCTVPEPATLGIIGMGVLALVHRKRK